MFRRSVQQVHQRGFLPVLAVLLLRAHSAALRRAPVRALELLRRGSRRAAYKGPEVILRSKLGPNINITAMYRPTSRRRTMPYSRALLMPCRITSRRPDSPSLFAVRGNSFVRRGTISSSNFLTATCLKLSTCSSRMVHMAFSYCDGSDVSLSSHVSVGVSGDDAGRLSSGGGDKSMTFTAAPLSVLTNCNSLSGFSSSIR